MSRSQVFQFQPLQPEEIKLLIRRALEDDQRGLGGEDVQLDDDALELLAQLCDGDARTALFVHPDRLTDYNLTPRVPEIVAAARRLMDLTSRARSIPRKTTSSKIGVRMATTTPNTASSAPVSSVAT